MASSPVRRSFSSSAPLVSAAICIRPAAYANWLEGLFNAGEAQQGKVAWLVCGAPVVLGAGIVYAMAMGKPVIAFLLNVAGSTSHGFASAATSHRYPCGAQNDDNRKAREALSAWRQENAPISIASRTRWLSRGSCLPHRYVVG